jgi:hemoglobin
MKKSLSICTVLIFSLALTSCSNLTPSSNLYQEIGGDKTLNNVFGLAVSRIYKDPVLAPHFKGVPKKYLRKKLVLQTCELIGGPCVYDGKSMHEVHKEQVVTDTQFYRVVEHVQSAMRDIGLTYQQENKILQKLVQLKSSIVYQK